MVWKPTNHNCPQCGGQLYDDPTRDVLACEDCKRHYTEESVVEWKNGGDTPVPIAGPGNRE